MTDLNRGTRSSDGDLDRLKDDMANLREDLGQLVEHLRRGATESAARQAQRIYDQLATQGERSANAIAREVEERPLTALLIAFGIGFIGGRLLTR
ncbi:MAG: hypothetical protein QOK29_3495 [Rhodospirillaceae bacterium]|jgi:hypothetical protein|nr:hypothetical protein [Rhodospirillaceae bacterium]